MSNKTGESTGVSYIEQLNATAEAVKLDTGGESHKQNLANEVTNIALGVHDEIITPEEGVEGLQEIKSQTSGEDERG